MRRVHWSTMWRCLSFIFYLSGFQSWKKNSFVILLSKGMIYESQYVKQTRGNREESLNSRTICELDSVRLCDCLGMGGRKVGPQVFWLGDRIESSSITCDIECKSRFCPGWWGVALFMVSMRFLWDIYVVMSARPLKEWNLRQDCGDETYERWFLVLWKWRRSFRDRLWAY